MNTIRSVGYGWGVLIVAGGGAYIFAKRSINADRSARLAAEQERYQRQEKLRQQEYILKAPPAPRSSQSLLGGKSNGTPGEGVDKMGVDPSMEASQDPAPTRHAPVSEGERVDEKSKYEAAAPWRSKKGDRFS
ncbi:hypothetical protein LTS18_009186 [Coniosporium uncinatum]|uniref:Uncharacterized protein n=2 Tax=Coniosporium uncinatum TaxID=93489 RepID=A0ACC3D9R2_9PEZI|nr:hypothetical protein LTS18_010244 [Coniosporium uncinatum]KAK3081195.1 hypothetical protein LTS18_009186 [Coniosporium uncinatum]